jgi:hypothetical protein
MEYIIGAILGLCFFIVPIWAYRKGLNDGLKINGNKPLEPIKPIKSIKQQFDKHEPSPIEKLMSEGISNIMSYTGEPQKKAGDD